MEIKELQNLKKRIDDAKTEMSKMQGVVEQIKKDWKKNFECDNDEELKKLIQNLEKSIKTLQDKADNYSKDIEKSLSEIDE